MYYQLRPVFFCKLLACAALVFAPWAHGHNLPTDAVLQEEIKYLLNQVEAHNQCQFICDGKVYGSQDTLKYIRQKQQRFITKIHSAEDFIDITASRNLMSNKPYFIQCPGRDRILSQKWFLQRLEQYRKQSHH